MKDNSTDHVGSNNSNGPKKTKGERSKELLLQTTIDLLLERKNSEWVTIRDITRAAKVSYSQLTYHFKNRTELFQQIMLLSREQIMHSPVKQFLEQNRELLASRDGQAIFITNLLCSYRNYFSVLPASTIRYIKVSEILQKSMEFSGENPVWLLYCEDGKAFYEIYRIITGKDDRDVAYFWFLTCFRPLANFTLSGRRHPENLSETHTFSDDFGTGFLSFCHKRLLEGLNLKENIKESNVQESFN